MTPDRQPNTAAFVRVEGTLVRSSVMAAAAYFAMHARGFRERAWRLGQVALTTPVYHVVGQSDRTLANRLAYLPLRGMSEDRVHELAEEYFHELLEPNLLQGGFELLDTARRQGHRVVLISDGLTQVMQLLAERVRCKDSFVCNRLEFRRERATGRLLEPVIGGHDSGRWVGEFAEQHDIELARSVAYGAHGPDLLLLTRVGQPCAVNPDFTLRRAAQDAEWPVMDYRT